jgi:nucleoid DNA-binding protein
MCPHLNIFLHNVESLAIKKCKSRHIKNPNTNTNVAIPAYPMPTEEGMFTEI